MSEPNPPMADPMPIAFGLFAFALAIFGVRFATVSATTLASGSTTEALNYALLVASVAQTLGGILGIIRGIGYPAYVTTTFGIWLFGFFLLVTAGKNSAEFTPNALAAYVMILAIPVAIMAVPAFVHRNIPFMIAFVALLALLLLVGYGYHELYNQATDAAKTKTAPDLSTAVNLVKASGYAAWVAAAAIWWVFAQEVYRLSGVTGRKTTPVRSTSSTPLVMSETA